MDNMLKKIVEVDEQARKITQEALIQKEKETQVINESKKTIYDEYIQLAKGRINTDVSQTKEKYETKLEETIEKHNYIKEKLTTTFENNKEEWVNTIFNNIVN